MPVRTLKRTRQVTSKYNPKRRRTYARRRRGLKANIPRLALRLFETKKKETSWQETGLNTLAGWFTNHASMILSQGDSYGSFEGHIVRGKGIKFTGWFKNNATSSAVMRFGVMCVKQGNSGISDWASGSNVIENISGNQSITTSNSVSRLCGRWNTDLYRPVRQYQCKLGPNQASDGTDIKQFSIWIPLNGQAFRYDGSDTLPTRNVMSFYAVSCLANNDEISGETVECSGVATFYYVDP